MTLLQEVLNTETAHPDGGQAKTATKGELVAEVVVHTSLQKNLNSIELLLQHAQPPNNTDDAEDGTVLGRNAPKPYDRHAAGRHWRRAPDQATLATGWRLIATAAAAGIKIPLTVIEGVG